MRTDLDLTCEAALAAIADAGLTTRDIDGLACYPGGGTVDGFKGDHVLLAPPYIAAPRDIEMIVERLGEAVDAAIADVPR